MRFIEIVYCCWNFTHVQTYRQTQQKMSIKTFTNAAVLAKVANLKLSLTQSFPVKTLRCRPGFRTREWTHCHPDSYQVLREEDVGERRGSHLPAARRGPKERQALQSSCKHNEKGHCLHVAGNCWKLRVILCLDGFNT